MLVFEFKAYGNKSQFVAVDEAIRTAQFVRNSCIRLWMDNNKIGQYDLQKYCAVLAHEFPFADALNSQAETCLVPNELGLPSLDSTTLRLRSVQAIARRKTLAKKGIHSLKKTVVLSSIKLADGNSPKIESL